MIMNAPIAFINRQPSVIAYQISTSFNFLAGPKFIDINFCQFPFTNAHGGR